MREIKVLNCNNTSKDYFLSSYILSVFPNLPKSVLFKALRNKDIRINGKRVSQDTKIKNDDILQIYIIDKYLFNLPEKLEYIYQDENILAVFKPQGILSNNEYYDDESAISYITEPTLEDLVKNDFNSAKICHRLDRNTSGIILFSLNDNAYDELLFGFRVGAISKNYIAYVNNANFEKKHEVLEKYILKDSKTGFSKVYDEMVKDSQKIITEYTVKYTDSKYDYAILDVAIHTGKTHQIRAQLKELGHPLIGDPKYGKNEINKKFKIKKQLLFAYKYSFDFKKSSVLYYLNDTVISLDEKLLLNKLN